MLFRSYKTSIVALLAETFPLTAEVVTCEKDVIVTKRLRHKSNFLIIHFLIHVYLEGYLLITAILTLCMYEVLRSLF